MFKNYFKVAIRSILKQKGLAFINLFGLSVGIACFSLFLLYAINEFTFDSFHNNARHIFRVYQWTEALGSDPAQGMSYNPMPLGPALKTEFPDVNEAIRFKESWGESFIKYGNKVTREEVSFADAPFFKVFSFKLKSGDASSVFSDAHNIVLTEESAKKLFGAENPIGKTIQIKVFDRFDPFIVAGIAENIPSNSSISFKILGNFDYLNETADGKRMNSWHSISFQTYIEVREGSKLASNPNSLIAFRKKYYPEEDAKSRKEGWTGSGPRTRYQLQPIEQMHTDTKIYGGVVAPVSPKSIWILITIAASVLLIACINFTTLSIGRSANRSKEVGIRKVIGGTKKSLVFQFLTEALLLTVLSTLMAVLLMNLLLPYFNELSGKDLKISFYEHPLWIECMIGLIIIVGLLSGSYPAWILSGFRPIEVLKMKIRLSGSNFFTKSLVTLQFVVSSALIISTLIIIKQLRYMQQKNPGFDKENVMVIDASGMEKTKDIYSSLKNELQSEPSIKGMASAELGLGEGEGWSQSGFKYNGKDELVYEFNIDHDYLDVLGMKLIAGRNFDPGIASDTVTSVIINQKLADEFGWTVENAVGQKLTGYSENKTPIVIGVVKDFNYLPFNEAIKPQLFQQFSSYNPFRFFVKLKAGNPQQAINKIETAWRKIVPAYPFKYSFLDLDLDRFYKSERRLSGIVGWAGGISIFLACLGLFGLAALSVVNRTKEIGIRKVLGASVQSIMTMISKDFIRIVIIALIIAIPLAWYLMNKWLQDYPYRIHIDGWVFILSALATLVIAMVTVGIQSLKASIVNPVKSIMNE